jgi:flagellar FliJ protein
MSGLTRLQPLIEIARSREQQLARELYELRQRESREKQRLEELNIYLMEYQTGVLPLGVLSVTRFHSRQMFVQQLNQAILQQQQRLERLQEQIQMLIEHWQQQSTEAKCLNELIKRYRQSEELAHSRRQQRETDEIALRRRQAAW